MFDIFIARQPIFDRQQKLIGYELLYRGSDVEIAEFADGNLASSDVIINSFMNIGVDSLVGSAKAFINVPTDFVLDENLTPMFPEHVVLEVLESVQPSAAVVDGVKRLKQVGYEIALDDFVFQPGVEALLAHTDYIKLDIQELSQAEVLGQVKKLHGYNLKLVAEKVETPEEFEFCLDAGFDLFQGFHFCKPQLLKRKHLPANKLVVLKVVEKLQDQNIPLHEVEVLLANDVGLTYRLLRYVNSAAFSGRKQIESIHEALALVGMDKLKKWASMILLTQLGSGKPKELFVTALLRARMCELVALRFHPQLAPQMFTIGLFSILNALLDMAMEDILDELGFVAEIRLALLDHEGEQGTYLRECLEYINGDWVSLVTSGKDISAYMESYLDAVKWTDATIQGMFEI